MILIWLLSHKAGQGRNPVGGGAAGRVPWWSLHYCNQRSPPPGQPPFLICTVTNKCCDTAREDLLTPCLDAYSQICEFHSNRSPPMGIYFCCCSCHSNSHALKGYSALNAAKRLRTQRKTPKRAGAGDEGQMSEGWGGSPSEGEERSLVFHRRRGGGRC